ncbi:glycoside hydrolase family 81 protein [Thermothelomyces heterothallicus CBS 203.75]
MGRPWEVVFTLLIALQGVLSLPTRVIRSPGASGTAWIVASAKHAAGGVIPPILETAKRVTPVSNLTTSVPKPTPLLVTASAVASLHLSLPTGAVNMAGQDIFADPISTDAPPATFGKKGDHPVPRLGVRGNGPFETNKFYGSLQLGAQTSPVFLHPYSVLWARGGGSSKSWGLAISHIEASQRVYGETNQSTGAAEYFLNPVGIHSVCLSAKELGNDTALTTEELTDFSVRVGLRPSAEAPPAVQFPLVQGLGFITAIYDGATPVFQTGERFKAVTRASGDPKDGVVKYKLELESGTTWLAYAHHTEGDPLDLESTDTGLAQAKGPFRGFIQVAKDPGDGEKVYDQAAGAYATGVQLSGSVDGARGTYTFSFKKAGIEGTTLVMFALPHHVGSFDDATKAKVTDLKLQTTTKGVGAAVVADSWTMVEDDLPTNIGFLPWSPGAGSAANISDGTKQAIHGVAQAEVSQDIKQLSDVDSMYFAGKALAKYATLVLAIREMLGDQAMAQTGLNQLKEAFARFAQNQQKYPLVYESAWGGVVSSATYETGDTGLDFGNTLYNDHHFHWGYFIYTAAVIGHLDPSWAEENKAYVNTLVRDIANPSPNDQYFPLWRSFDWYHGHSWAHGLFDALDGKDQESSSEDTMHTYALKLWGSTIGDTNLEARGNLMLAVQSRSLRSYYLYTSDNTIQDPKFIGNKVAGILFENKIHHTTYFGNNIEYIQGIHMLPLLPQTPYVRTPAFVREEWETYFSNGRADAVGGGWRGVLLGNYATVDPKGAYDFFARSDFDSSWLDDGATRTWYMCYAAGEYPPFRSVPSTLHLTHPASSGFRHLPFLLLVRSC